MFIFGRRVQKSAYTQAEGQPGRGRLGAGQHARRVAGHPGRRRYTRTSTPCTGCIGRPGVILVGEGAPHRVEAAARAGEEAGRPGRRRHPDLRHHRRQRRGPGPAAQAQQAPDEAARATSARRRSTRSRSGWPRSAARRRPPLPKGPMPTGAKLRSVPAHGCAAGPTYAAPARLPGRPRSGPAASCRSAARPGRGSAPGLSRITPSVRTAAGRDRRPAPTGPRRTDPQLPRNRDPRRLRRPRTVKPNVSTANTRQCSRIAGQVRRGRTRRRPIRLRGAPRATQRAPPSRGPDPGPPIAGPAVRQPATRRQPGRALGTPPRTAADGSCPTARVTRNVCETTGIRRGQPDGHTVASHHCQPITRRMDVHQLPTRS